MNRFRSILLGICFSVTCTAAFGQIDDFESYASGDIDGQGPWIDFGGLMVNEVSSDFAFSGTKSLKQTIGPIVGNPVEVGYGSDLFMDLPLKRTSGQWVFRYQLYVPASFNGAAISLGSEGSIAEGDFNAGMYLVADGTEGFNEFLHSIDGSTAESPPRRLIRDQWVEIDSLIDLDNNAVEVFYDGNLLFSGAWDPIDPASGPDAGEHSIGGINLWVQGGNGGSVYYDDISLFAVPEPRGVLCLLCGFAALGHRYRRR